MILSTFKCRLPFPNGHKSAYELHCAIFPSLNTNHANMKSKTAQNRFQAVLARFLFIYDLFSGKKIASYQNMYSNQVVGDLQPRSKVLTTRSYQFSEDIQTAQNELKQRYEQFQNYFWGLVGGSFFAIVLVTAFSTKFFFGQAVDRNFNVMLSTYNQVGELRKQIGALEHKLNKSPDNSEKKKK
ncbi:hypothetical protein XBI1_2680006 [Xenorhabdus bovienii str. Intermedium]|uniref:Uncharacterized protein n=2 Tax=Xenorhabdus bovienii TaxID=40576 RepID=A0A077QJZ1_XENBV|nr:hypothetical protein XBI1_2680006 [Xenorhabdus bovienii str. Intermedium]